MNGMANITKRSATKRKTPKLANMKIVMSSAPMTMNGRSNYRQAQLPSKSLYNFINEFCSNLKHSERTEVISKRSENTRQDVVKNPEQAPNWVSKRNNPNSEPVGASSVPLAVFINAKSNPVKRGAHKPVS
jgi:hypothetical protein